MNKHTSCELTRAHTFTTITPSLKLRVIERKGTPVLSKNCSPVANRAIQQARDPIAIYEYFKIECELVTSIIRIEAQTLQIFYSINRPSFFRLM
jgi:hypothetical protein